MARPRKGEDVREKVISVRMTKDEAAELTDVFGGKPAVGLRAIYDAWKAQRGTQA